MKFSHWLLTMVVIAAMSGVSFWVKAEEPVVIEAWPDKVLYDAGETATFDIALKNTSQSPVSGKLKVGVIWEMEDTKMLAEQAVNVAAGATNRVTVKWEKMPEVLGCEVKAELIGNDGKTIAMGSEYFNVCRHLDTLRVGVHSTLPGNYYIPNQPFRDQIPKEMKKMREGYVNIVEFHTSASDGWNLAPQGDEWLRELWVSREGAMLGISEAHKYGMKTVIYAVAYTKSTIDDLNAIMRHPEWFVYDKLGQPAGTAVDVAVEARRRNPKKYDYHPSCFGGTMGNYQSEAHIEYHINQIIANQKMFGMDGVRYDGHPASFSGFDINGKPMPAGEEQIKESVRIINKIKKEVKAACPNYLFMYNCGRAVGAGKPIDLEKGTLAPELAPLAEDGGALCDEEIRNADMSYHDMHAWKDCARCLVSDVDLCRKVGGYAYVIFPYAFQVCRNSDEMGYTLLLAAGHHPWFSFPQSDRSFDVGGTHYPIQKELLAFATRFSAQLWGKGIDRVREPEKVVEVSSAKGDIWWKWYVHERKLADGRKYLITHLINAPPTKEIGIKEQPLAEPIKDVVVQYKIPVKKAWLASARPGPARVVTLKPEQRQGTDGNRAPTHEAYGPLQYGVIPVENGKAMVPELRVWSMLVAEVQ